MLVKLVSPRVTPRQWATLTVEGGLVYSRVVPKVTLGDLSEYARTSREVLPRKRDRPRWKRPRVQRISYPAGRTVRPGRPPVRTPVGGAPPDRQRGGSLFGWLTHPADGLTHQWERRYLYSPPVGSLGVPTIGAPHRGRVRFTRWASQPRRGWRPYPAGWAYQPRKQQDPLREYWGWTRLGGRSFLCGFRSSFSTRGGYLQGRRRGLARRERLLLGANRQVERLFRYRRFHYGKGRRRLPRGGKRFYLFRRRRLRGGVARKFSGRVYFRGVTRRTFRGFHLNRFSRLERAALLGGGPVPYYSARALWSSWNLGSRVGVPMDYRYYRPHLGYGRLVKKKRLIGRPWKLGQHPRWQQGFNRVRGFRAAWFEETGLGRLLSQARTTPVDPVNPPLRGGFPAGMYWSTRFWGRGGRFRTDRPTRRAKFIFAGAVKNGTSAEVEPMGEWGAASTSATGVLLGMITQYELRPVGELNPTPPVEVVRSVRSGNLLTRWATRVALGVALGVATGVAHLWRWGFTPVWWVYSGVARLWGWFFWPFRVGWFYLVGVVVFFGSWGWHFGTLLYHSVVDWCYHKGRDLPLVKLTSWVTESWVMAYSAENAYEEFEVSAVTEEDDVSKEYYQDELDTPGENLQDFDQLGDRLHVQAPRPPLGERWGKDWDSFWWTWVDTLEEFFLHEVPYQVGLWVRPFYDLVVRLPLWGALEGVSLWGLTMKLEFQRRWTSLLLRGGPTRGRVWKIPLLLGRLVVILVGWVFLVYLVGSQLSYSTLRLELTELGVTWQDEYYLGWWVLVFTGVSRVLAPRGVQRFLFTEVGWANWGGLFWGVTAEVADPEEYYPARPAGPFERTLYTGMGGQRVRDWQNPADELYEDRFRLGGVDNLHGYDQVRLILARAYHPIGTSGYAKGTYDDENYFLFPPHLGLRRESNRFALLAAQPREDLYRGFREPHLDYHNKYELYFTSPWEVNEIHAAQTLPDNRADNDRSKRLTYLKDQQGTSFED